MKLFERIPDKFFSILTSSKKELYVEALFVLRQAFKTELESFRRIINWLLAHTYLLQGNYVFDDGMKRTNPDYLFVERQFGLFQDYLEYSGFHLERDGNYGVIFISSTYEYNRVKFDKATTLMLYVLRLIYEEEREKLSLSRDIFTSTGDLVHKMISLGVIKKKPSNLVLRDSLRTLNRFRVIEKPDGSWEAADTKLLILPTILFIVSLIQYGTQRYGAAMRIQSPAYRNILKEMEQEQIILSKQKDCH